MWSVGEDDGYYVARVAIYNAVIITCQILPWAMMYIFSWDIIHSAIAGIYYCHNWARVKQPGKIIFLCRYPRERQKAREEPVFFSICLIMTLFSSYHSQRFTMQSQGWNLFTATRLHQIASSSPQTKTALRAKMAESHWRVQRLPALLEFRLNFLSLSTPGWPPAHAFLSFFPFLPFIKIICRLHFTVET